ncbi:YebG family protein [Erwinia billingiae]|uniref:YebG family protein n=1 Tax=Erwinia billingiae TaxID=182337 RepID=UPI0032079B48
MAVEIKYVVVRKGEEKMTFASKKEADAYDKMLDMAEAFSDWLSVAPLDMEEPQREALGMFLAENKDAVQHILRTSKMPETSETAAVGNDAEPNVEQDTVEAAAEEPSEESDAEEPEASTGKAAKAKSAARTVKAA